MTSIQINRLTKRFGHSAALADVSLDFAEGTFNALLGPSGCGKTTLLRLIAGFEAPSEGEVRFNGEVVATSGTQLPPEGRGIGVVFQSYALWPHMDVGANVAYPLKMQGVGKVEIGRRLNEVLSTVGLTGFESRKIDELSGGQRQRVALARCLIADTGIILFDEPLANLDVHLRASMVEVFREVHRKSGATIVYVTHDQAEALAISDKVAVMQGGKVLQFAAPEDVYARPAAAAVARFVGRGGIVPGVATAGRVEVGDYRFAVRSVRENSGPVQVLLRPENLRLADEGIPAQVLSSTYRGAVHEVRLAVEGSSEGIVVDSPVSVHQTETVKVAVSDAWIIPS